MKRHYLTPPALFAACLLSGFALVLAASPARPAVANDFVDLFDGETLNGWHGRQTMAPGKYAETTAEQREKWQQETAAHWQAKDGAIVNDGQGPYLTTDQDYGDYELFIDYKTVAGADSGIYLREVPQVQIWDYTDEKKFGIGADKGSGGLWNNAPGAKGKDPLVLADKPFGEWNTMRILQVGEMVSVWLNDKMVVDHARMANYWDRDSPFPARGPIQLQTHGGEISWKNIRIREIPSDEANAILAEKAGDGFASIFDGKSLAGWQGAVDDYEVVDGALQCKPSRGGNLFTTESYGDFVVRMQFRLPPGGNNGLAIRYPGEGNPAYAAMTELQVLDNTAAKYAKLDPRQYHGSAYGMAAAARGYLRPVGEWNYQQVTVRGSTIQVELNGTLILDTDLAKVSEYMADSPHPGKDRTSGHFGFAGHNDPVAFRDLAIKPLD
ncbi:3-keto-disaccharide hydrolase [Planctomycetaceae bacterium SH139]